MITKSLVVLTLISVNLAIAFQAPAEVLDMNEFEINTPSFNTDGSQSLKVNLSENPTYKSEYFNVVLNGVRMKVPNSGALENGSSNPSAELSELYRWRLPSGEHTLDVSLTVQKMISGVSFDIGQILRHETDYVYSDGATCSDHLQIELQSDLKILLRYRDPSCAAAEKLLDEVYEIGTRIDYQVRLQDGVMTFKTNAMDTAVEVRDFNFLSDEYSGRAEGGYFRAGVYPQDSCSSGASSGSGCNLGTGADDLTIVDFHQVDIKHINSQRSVECPVLTESGPIEIDRDGQIVENLVITAGDSWYDETSVRVDGFHWKYIPGINCVGFSDVIIRNVYVKHYPQGMDAHAGSTAEAYYQQVIADHPESTPVVDEDAERDHGVNTIPSEAALSPYSMGIYFENCQNLTIENVRVEFVDPPSGPAHLSAWKNYNICGYDSDGVTIRDAIMSGGSDSIWVKNCNHLTVSNWASYNIHGPFPRGHCIQTAYCKDVLIENFICKNQWMHSYTGDTMNLWRTTRLTVSNGVILGENSNTGTGLMFEESDILEEDTTNAWVNVDNVWGKGLSTCFSTYGGTNVTWTNVGCRDNYCGFRGNRDWQQEPSGIMFYGGWENPSEIENCCYATNLRLKQSKFWNTCHKPWIWSNKTYCPDAWMEQDLIAEDFDLNEHPIELRICFKINDTVYEADTGAGTGDIFIKNVGLFGDGSIDDNSQYDVNAENTWGECDQDFCYGNENQTWERKCTWGKCGNCMECVEYWPIWVESNLSSTATTTDDSSAN